MSFISKIATGTILKFAAIGVISVPQKPQVSARLPTIVGSAPNANTNGAPIPTLMTVIAAKAFPITIVNKAMPIA